MGSMDESLQTTGENNPCKEMSTEKSREQTFFLLGGEMFCESIGDGFDVFN